jgi:FkbM family methyltransferase
MRAHVSRSLKYHLYSSTCNFPYFGYRVYFPKGCSSFHTAFEQGVFEADNVRILQKLCRPGSYMLDVGANLGLMALPVLRCVPDARVISFEPSPNTAPWLKQTIAQSGVTDRWQLIEKAVACAPGVAQFSLSTLTQGLYDGLRHTKRTNEVRTVEVEVTTLDEEWERLGCPDLSVIKIDVEGGELDVLLGGRECLKRTRPFVLSEWCSLNIQAYGIRNDSLLQFAREHDYLLYGLPEMIRVNTPKDLEMQAMRTESFLMVPLQ